MTKQSKRSRKFQASGGVQGRLKKGTMTKHGKLKKRGHTAGDEPTATSSNKALAAEPRRDRSNDLAAPKNLGTLDLDSFFSQVAENLKDGADDMPVEDEKSDDDSSSEAEEGAKASSKKKPKGASSESSSSSDDDDDGDSDDDMEAAEERMKKEMARLTEKDPEFHQFLKENEEQLLDFGHEEGDEAGEDNKVDEEDEEAMDEDDGAQEKKPAKAADSGALLTIALLDKLRRNAFEAHGIKALKKLVAAYKAGCHLADTVGDEKQTYAIESSQVFDSLMVLCLSRCHEAFTYHLLGQVDVESKKEDDKTGDADHVDPDNQAIPPHKLENAKKWDVIKPILQSFLRSTIHLLTESKEPGLLSFVLKSLAKYLPLTTPFPRIAEALLKTCIGLWSAPLDSSENFQVVRLQAFFRIRQLALTQPFPFIETCLKKTYLAYSQRATFGTSSSLATTLPTLTFMGNCLVELYSLDYQSSYQHAFVYIRQLALQLRTAVQKMTPEALNAVYGSWQYMHCLKLWVAVLAQAATKEDEDPDAKVMASLVYPLTEIIAGTARTAPSPVRLLPLRLQCIRLLQQLAASAQIYLPTTSLILDCFDWKEWTAKPKKSTKKNTLRGGLPLYMLIKLPKEDPLRTHEQLEAALVQLFVLLEREMDLYRYTAAFAEFRVRIRQRCRDFLKSVRSSRWKAYAKACMDKSDEYAKFCTAERAKLSLAPKDITTLECLRPSHVPTMRERHEKSLEQETKLAQSSLAAAAAESMAKKQSKGDQDDDDDDDDEAPDDDDDDGSKDEEKPAKAKKAKKSKEKKKKPKQSVAMVEDNDEVMEQEDEVVAGVDWLEE